MTMDRRSGRTSLRASRSRNMPAASSPTSTAASPMRPRSMSSSRSAVRLRIRRSTARCAAATSTGTRWIAASNSAGAVSTACSQPRPTARPGRRSSSRPQRAPSATETEPLVSTRGIAAAASTATTRLRTPAERSMSAAMVTCRRRAASRPSSRRITASTSLRCAGRVASSSAWWAPTAWSSAAATPPAPAAARGGSGPMTRRRFTTNCSGVSRLQSRRAMVSTHVACAAGSSAVRSRGSSAIAATTARPPAGLARGSAAARGHLNARGCPIEERPAPPAPRPPPARCTTQAAAARR